MCRPPAFPSEALVCRAAAWPLLPYQGAESKLQRPVWYASCHRNNLISLTVRLEGGGKLRLMLAPSISRASRLLLLLPHSGTRRLWL